MSSYPRSFADLPAHHCAVLDIGSLEALLDDGSVAFLQGKSKHFLEWTQIWTEAESKQGPTVAASIILDTIRKDVTLTQTLNLIDRFVAYEHIIVDRVALESAFARRRIGSVEFDKFVERVGFLLPIEVPREVYQSALHIIEANRSLIKELKGQLESGDFDGPDKTFHDFLLDSGGRPSFADSSDVPERAVFYALVSEKGSAPLIVSHAKERLLERIRGLIVARLVSGDPHSLIVRRATRLHAEEDADSLTQPIPLPPAAEEIFLAAVREGTSIVEELVKLRKQKPARAYRDFVFRLDRLSRGALGSRAEAAALYADIEKHIAAWKVDPAVGVKYTKRALHLEKLPLVGWVAGIGGHSGWDIKDPVLTSLPAHLRFISGWFDRMKESPASAETRIAQTHPRP